MSKILQDDLKQKWVAALRSGEFEQGQSFLYSSSTNTYCCLGVLESICGLSKEKMDGTGMPGALETRMSPVVLDEWSGNNRWADKLANMNDTGKSFEEIADFIEENM